MGNREDLLAGAKRCLLEKGYLRTTARDIATASGVSLAAIGYHFGSKDALMSVALVEAVGDFGEDLDAALTKSPPGGTSRERFVAAWDRIVELFPAHRSMWIANFELLGHADLAPDAYAAILAAQNDARADLAQTFQDVSGLDEDAKLNLGKLYQAMLLGVVALYFVDTETAPTGTDLADAMTLICAKLADG